MINTEKGKRYGTILIPFHYNGARMDSIMTYLLIVPISIGQMKYNWEIIGSSDYFDELDDMETVPLYDLRITWDGLTSIRNIDVVRSLK